MVEKERSPTHRAYSVVKRAGRDESWLEIGSGLPHEDGHGFTVLLTSYPRDGKVICRSLSGNGIAQVGPLPRPNTADDSRQTRPGPGSSLSHSR